MTQNLPPDHITLMSSILQFKSGKIVERLKCNTFLVSSTRWMMRLKPLVGFFIVVICAKQWDIMDHQIRGGSVLSKKTLVFSVISLCRNYLEDPHWLQQAGRPWGKFKWDKLCCCLNFSRISRAIVAISRLRSAIRSEISGVVVVE